MNHRGMTESRIARKERLEALGRLAGSVAHDFNNLLLVIAANAQSALAASPPVAQAELSEIARSAEEARNLVRELLAFTEIEAYEPRLLYVNDAVEGTRRTVEGLLPGPVQIRTELTHDDTTIFADANLLERALLNLAVRAGDAMPVGGVLTIATRCEHEAVVLSVSDTGVHRHGSGLGLATLHGIVARAHGTIAVDATPVRGTTLTVRFPSAAALAQAA
jgi:two-component system, cell cycle sensor histidine kinase and response regulator CckA